MIIAVELQLVKRNNDYAIDISVIITDREIAFSEIFIPAYSIEQLLDRDHLSFPGYCFFQ